MAGNNWWSPSILRTTLTSAADAVSDWFAAPQVLDLTPLRLTYRPDDLDDDDRPGVAPARSQVPAQVGADDNEPDTKPCDIINYRMRNTVAAAHTVEREDDGPPNTHPGSRLDVMVTLENNALQVRLPDPARQDVSSQARHKIRLRLWDRRPCRLAFPNREQPFDKLASSEWEIDFAFWHKTNEPDSNNNSSYSTHHLGVPFVQDRSIYTTMRRRLYNPQAGAPRMRASQKKRIHGQYRKGEANPNGGLGLVVHVDGNDHPARDADSEALDWKVAHIIMYQLNADAWPVCISARRAKYYYNSATQAVVYTNAATGEAPELSYYYDNENGVCNHTVEYASYRLRSSPSKSIAFQYSRIDTLCLWALERGAQLRDGSRNEVPLPHIVIWRRDANHRWVGICFKVDRDSRSSAKPKATRDAGKITHIEIPLVGRRLYRELALDRTDQDEVKLPVGDPAPIAMDAGRQGRGAAGKRAAGSSDQQNVRQKSDNDHKCFHWEFPEMSNNAWLSETKEFSVRIGNRNDNTFGFELIGLDMANQSSYPAVFRDVATLRFGFTERISSRFVAPSRPVEESDSEDSEDRGEADEQWERDYGRTNPPLEIDWVMQNPAGPRTCGNSAMWFNSPMAALFKENILKVQQASDDGATKRLVGHPIFGEPSVPTPRGEDWRDPHDDYPLNSSFDTVAGYDVGYYGGSGIGGGGRGGAGYGPGPSGPPARSRDQSRGRGRGRGPAPAPRRPARGGSGGGAAAGGGGGGGAFGLEDDAFMDEDEDDQERERYGEPDTHPDFQDDDDEVGAGEAGPSSNRAGTSSNRAAPTRPSRAQPSQGGGSASKAPMPPTDQQQELRQRRAEQAERDAASRVERMAAFKAEAIEKSKASRGPLGHPLLGGKGLAFRGRWYPKGDAQGPSGQPRRRDLLTWDMYEEDNGPEMFEQFAEKEEAEAEDDEEDD